MAIFGSSSTPSRAELRTYYDYAKRRCRKLFGAYVDRPVVFRVQSLTNDFAETNLHEHWKRPTYEVKVDLDRHATIDELKDTFIHEWAHILTWDLCDENASPHTDEWGKAYAFCYRVFVEDGL